MPERRYLSILFADLAGYTALSERLDPEDLRDLQLRYQDIALTEIERQGGFVASFHGDGVLAYFGYPTASETDAERAVRAGLALVERMPEIADPAIDGAGLSARVGVHTGLVVIGPEKSSAVNHEHSIVGEAANIAARLQAHAPRDSVVVSHATHELVRGIFETESLGERHLRGLSRPIEVHRTLRPRRNAGRIRHGHALPMVGRAAELAALRDHWLAVVGDGRCRVVDVIGEPGVGKTRLLREFCTLADLADARVLRSVNLELYATTPLHSVAAMLMRQLRLGGPDDPAAMLRKVMAWLDSLGLASPVNAAMVADLLGRPLPSAGGAGPLPTLLRRRQFELICDLMEHAVRRQPALLWVEDAHWMDPSSVELLGVLLARVRDMPVMVVLTRRAFPKPAALPAATASIALEPLSRAESIAMASGLPGAGALDSRLLARAVEIADGIPLFIEQLTLSLLRDGKASDRIGPAGAGEALPLTLAEILSARLDRLHGARHIVQAAACIGFQVPPPLLAAVAGVTPEAAVAVLNELVEAEILRHRGGGFEFRHALLQRVARDSMMRPDRHACHARIAAVLRDLAAAGDTALPETIAHHLTEAEQVAEAAAAWLQAGAAAAARQALREAIQHLRQGLAAVPRIEDPAFRLEIELKLQVQLVAPITATRGSTAPELAECCRRGLELCRLAPTSQAVFPFIFGLFTHLHCRGRYVEALQLAELFLETAQRRDNRVAEVEGHRLLGVGLASMRRHREARDSLLTAIRLFQPEWDAGPALMFSQHTLINATSLLGTKHFALGALDQAIPQMTQAVDLAIARRHPHTLAITLSYACFVFGMLGHAEAIAWCSSRLVALCEEHQLSLFLTLARAHAGWSRCLAGDIETGSTALQAAAEMQEAADFWIATPFLLGLAAEAHLAAGRRALAETLCARAERMLHRSDAGHNEIDPDAMRLVARVRVRLDPGNTAAPAAYLREAIAITRDSAAAYYEYRCLRELEAIEGPLPNTLERLAALADVPALEATARAMTGEWLQGRLALPAPAGDSAAPPVRGVPAAGSP